MTDMVRIDPDVLAQLAKPVQLVGTSGFEAVVRVDGHTLVVPTVIVLADYPEPPVGTVVRITYGTARNIIPEQLVAEHADTGGQEPSWFTSELDRRTWRQLTEDRDIASIYILTNGREVTRRTWGQ